jgi:hypothetical protein
MSVMAVKDRGGSLQALRQAQEDLRELGGKLEEVSRSLSQAGSEEGEVSVRELAEQWDVPEDAVVAFVQTAGELLGGAPLSVTQARRAAMIAAADVAWERELGPLLSGPRVRELLGNVSRQRVDELLRAHRLIGLRDSLGRRRFPLYQFSDGRPVQTIVEAFWTVADAGLDEWSTASWCVAADPALDGMSPVQWSKDRKDPEVLRRVARQDAARFAR